MRTRRRRRQKGIPRHLANFDSNRRDRHVGKTQNPPRPPRPRPLQPLKTTPRHHSCKDVVVPARDRAVVPTGIAIAAPSGTYARIAPRSGLAVKKFIDTGAGVVDEDYRGEVGVVLFNHSGEDFHGARTTGKRG